MKLLTFRPSKKDFREAGQVSLFLGIVVVVVISFLAFIINVGLFVKAKINLQNAVDAAAFAGASVQARQLTNVAYLNWELRNTFKEWMFKYYVLGQKGIEQTERENIAGHRYNNGSMNFRLQSFYRSGEAGFTGKNFDRFNVPSICIHYGSPHNICGIVSVPGLPRFKTVGLPGISRHHEQFLDTLVKSKAEDCSARSQVNMGTAMLWAYGTGFDSLPPNSPQIAAERPGAWVQALELGVRIRNLEALINTPPVENPICHSPTAGAACTTVQDIETRITDLPHYERSVKAFNSAFRNLGGGVNKENGASTDPFFSTFRLTELAPNPYSADSLSPSGFLIPPDSPYLEKPYLDLQIYPINYINFFTMFTSQNASLDGTRTQADCGAIKAALPVPGYILGFTKNPEVLTYYAVKGEAEFVGLFFPFSKTSGINLKAYAAAKPMGGRIGPKLFKIEGSSIFPREEAERKLTSNYASALDVLGIIEPSIKGGFPIPTVDDFWANISTNTTIGGIPGSGDQVFFTVPNLLYDFENVTELKAPQWKIQRVEEKTNYTQAYESFVSEKAGLYNQKQFALFEANQDISAGPVMNNQQVLQSIFNVRRPTRYEALNYLIPVIAEDGDNPAGVDHNFYFYHSEADPHPLTKTKSYNVFGPLFGPNTLYPEVASITNAISDYINANTPAIDKYIAALQNVASGVRDSSPAGESGKLYETAAASINRNRTPDEVLRQGGLGCSNPSLAETFATFFKGTVEVCNISPLQVRIVEYFNELSRSNPIFQNYFTSSYETRDRNAAPKRNLETDPRYLMTGFVPGRRQGASPEGEVQRPFGGGATLFSKRNFYSTKFFAMQKIVANAAGKARAGDQQGFDLPSVFMEGASSGARFTASSDFQGLRIHNLIGLGELSEWEFLDL